MSFCVSHEGSISKMKSTGEASQGMTITSLGVCAGTVKVQSWKKLERGIS